MSAEGERRARIAPKARTTSDRFRGRDAWIVGGVAAVAAVAAVLVPARGSVASLGSPGPLTRPHAAKGIACAKCHDEGEARSGRVTACVGCHGAHALRPGHGKLADAGRLGCATCHPAHGGAQGVTFSADGAFVRWGHGSEVSGKTTLSPPAGQTVALVSTAACARCHDTTDRLDPAARCVSGRPGDRATYCFDEHQKLGAAAGPSRAVCDKQHGGTLHLAWEAAREASQRTEWLAPTKPAGTPWAPAGAALGAGAVALLAVGLARRGLGVRPRAAPPAAPSPVADGAQRKLPVIDTSRCIGCNACVDACPFDVLELDRFVAVVARPDDCCGVVLCEQACPNGSLSISTGELREERPAVDASLQAVGVPGLYVVGDLTGLPLIKNAIAQGARAVQAIHASRPRGGGKATVDVVIVGAGPAGLSAALAAKSKDLSCVVLEQTTFAASIRRFPRGKVVYDPPLDLPVEGDLWLKESTKEELLAQWTRIVRRHALPIREHRRVVAVRREGDEFVVEAATEGGAIEAHRGRRVVLAIGKRGTPRELGATIAKGAESRVVYSLADAASYAGSRVLVVGLGDSAMEAAVALARQPGTQVTLSYRGAAFARGKAKNIDEVRRLAADGRIKLLWESEVVRVGDGTAVVRHEGVDKTLSADVVLALIGGVPSWDLVESAGVGRVRAGAAP
ncbi:MAG: NAD(P)-binding domain-containing protein [Myxococcales bacterium]|nr:NAD(P)-binding domain-containing protein [Myxococcales bacterium]